MKYIINTDALYGGDIYKSMLLMGTNGRGEVIVQKFNLDELEELNGDYINEHYGSLQDEAYQRGLEEGKKATYGLVADASNAEYQRGLDDAWEAAKKILQMYDFTVFGLEHDGVFESPLNEGQQMTPQEAIEKLKAYEEQKADDEIKVGDEVVWTEDEDTVIIVTLIYTSSGIEWCDGICRDGKVYQIITEHARKTGKHFDIDKILEEMKE